jgi:hypothetical protein
MFWHIIDTKLTKSPILHPYGDGNKNLINRMILHILIMHKFKNPHAWEESHPYVQHKYNNTLHSFINHDLFGVPRVSTINPS